MRFPLALTTKIAAYIIGQKLRRTPKFTTVLQLEPLHTCKPHLHGLRVNPRILHLAQGHSAAGRLPGGGGGLILRCLAIRELVWFGPHDRGGGDEFGVVPLGMPLIAGPALLMELLILIDTVGLVYTLVSLLLSLAIVAVVLCDADRFTRWMGRQRLRGVSKLIALLLAAIAIRLIRRGWQTQ